MDAAFAAACALVSRGRTGTGHLVDVSMVDSMTRFMGPKLVAYLGSNELPRRSGGRDSVIAVYQVFETEDEPITLGLGNDEIWRRFWGAMGLADRALDAAHATNAGRRADREAIVAEIAALLARRPRTEWLERFAAAGVPAGPINRLDQVVTDPQLLERGLVYALDSKSGPVPQVGLGIQVDGRPARARRRPAASGRGGRCRTPPVVGLGRGAHPTLHMARA